MPENWTEIQTSPGSDAASRLAREITRGVFVPLPGDFARALVAIGARIGADNARSGAALARAFQAEPAYLFAQIASFDPGSQIQGFAVAAGYDPARSAAMVADLADRIRDWIARMPEADRTGPFSKQIARLNEEARLEARLENLAARPPDDVVAAVLADTVFSRRRPAGGLAAARLAAVELRATHTLLVNAAAALKPIAARAFEARILSGDVDPAMGLLIAELRAGETVRAEINETTERVIRFYYRDLLGQDLASAPAEPVMLRLAPAKSRVAVPAGARLQVREKGSARRAFVTETPLVAGPARIAGIATLGYRSDPRISFNAEFGWITGLDATSGNAPGDDPLGRPLFAAAAPVPAAPGIDIASPLLTLAEGARRVEVSLILTRGSDLPAVADPAETGSQARVSESLRADPGLAAEFGGISDLPAEIAAHCRECGQNPSMAQIYQVLAGHVSSASALRLLLGRILTLSLIEGAPFPTGAYRDRLAALIDRYRDALDGNGDADSEGFGSLALQALAGSSADARAFTPADIFQHLLGDAFQVDILGAAGAMHPAIAAIWPNRDGAGITLRLDYPETAPPIAPEKGAPAPVLRIRMSTQSRLCPVSLFERYSLARIGLGVQARGLAMPVAWSDDGPVSTDGDFAPFGARPRDAAGFVAASPEMAAKPVTGIGIALTWAEPPQGPAGFESHYGNYRGRGGLPDPKIDVEYLGADGWDRLTDAPVPMFPERLADGRLSRKWRFESQIKGTAHRPALRGGERDFTSRAHLPGGAIRLTLSDTAGGFRIDDYPLSLAEAMRPPRLPLPGRKPEVPLPPFVPRVAGFSVSYRAEGKIDLTAPGAANPGESVHRIGVFGKTELYPNRTSRETALFPPRLGYGHLFLRLEQAEPGTAVSLAFHMAAGGHLRLVPPANPLRWFCLTGDGWTLLDDTAIAADSTAGLMRSGVVTIDLPGDAAPQAPGMGMPGLWLAAAASGPDLGIFPRIRAIATNGVWVRAETGNSGESGKDRAWSFDPPRPGTGAISEMHLPGQVRPSEDRDAWTARIAERLHHRRRALTPWDMERLVLQEFPQVAMAKCLPHMRRRAPDPAPGRVTFAALRRAVGGGAGAAHLFDVSALQEIQDFLTALAPSQADIRVVNPAFDRLQVRGTLAFDAYRDDGAMARRLKQDLSRHLSVWTAPADLARFGWRLNLQLLAAWIADLDYVRSITDFSVLRLAAHDEALYSLADSAIAPAGESASTGTIHPSRPWALPISAASHALKIQAQAGHIEATPSGIGRLGVGDMLIVGKRTSP